MCVSAAGARHRGHARGPRCLRPRRPPRLEVAAAGCTAQGSRQSERRQGANCPSLTSGSAAGKPFLGLGDIGAGVRSKGGGVSLPNRLQVAADFGAAGKCDGQWARTPAPTAPSPRTGFGSRIRAAYSDPHVLFPSQRPAASSRRASQIRAQFAARRGAVDTRASWARASATSGAATQVLAMCYRASGPHHYVNLQRRAARLPDLSIGGQVGG